jgi:translation initiation factor IF-3
MNTEFLINEEIRQKEVLLIDENGNKVGKVDIHTAMSMADAANLDLIEISSSSFPHVCKIMDYGKFKYEKQKKSKNNNKKVQKIKEIQMSPNIGIHDYNFKVKLIQTFLTKGNKVKVIIFFKGREISFVDIGRNILKNVVQDTKDISTIESGPILDGRYLRISLIPK